jgi:hypothetical protein
MEGLKAAAPYVKGELARRLQMRRTPEVVFLLDRALERGTSVLGLLNQLERQREERGEIPPGSDEAGSGPADGMASEGPHGQEAAGTTDPTLGEEPGAPSARDDGGGDVAESWRDDGPGGP